MAPRKWHSLGAATRIDIEVCDRCGGFVKVIACIEDRDMIPDKAGQALDRILAHLRQKEQAIPILPLLTPSPRAPPETLPLFARSESKITMLNQQGR